MARALGYLRMWRRASWASCSVEARTATCACDAAGDGVTNPAPIDGNTAASVSADDDGGYFKQQSAAYYRAGAVALP